MPRDYVYVILYAFYWQFFFNIFFLPQHSASSTPWLLSQWVPSHYTKLSPVRPELIASGAIGKMVHSAIAKRIPASYRNGSHPIIQY